MDDTLKTTVGELAHVTDDKVDQLKSGLRWGIPSRPLLGRLPLRRWIPQDLHAGLDYAGGLALILSGALSRDRGLKLTGIILGAGFIGRALLTDHRLSAAKVIPIEVHEVSDHVASAAAMIVPFVARRTRRGRPTAWLQFAIGA